MEYPTGETPAILLLLMVFIFCLGFGLGMLYREIYPLFQRHRPEPRDEEIMIFDRVSDALSQLPPIEEAKAFEAAQAAVMRSVGERYALRADEVGAIYRRVWQWKHGTEG